MHQGTSYTGHLTSLSDELNLATTTSLCGLLRPAAAVQSNTISGYHDKRTAEGPHSEYRLFQKYRASFVL